MELDTLMRTMIESNYWNTTNQCMEIEPSTLHYELRIGEDYKYELRCEESKGGRKKPFIISSKVETYQNEENKELLVSFLTKLQVGYDKLKQKIKDKWGNGTVKFQFMLTQRGIRILHNNKSFICKNGSVSAGH